MSGLVMVDGTEVSRTPFQTDAKGKAMLRFHLPERIERGDGLLTILVLSKSEVRSPKSEVRRPLRLLR